MGLWFKLTHFLDRRRFNRYLPILFKFEGIYSNDKYDPGGETKYGISQRFHPDIDVKNLTKKQAADIYYREYWLAAGCDRMEYQMAVVVFDTAVNMGVKRAKAWAQIFKSPTTYLDRRERFYRRRAARNKDARRFLRGWLSRVDTLRVLMA